MRPLSDAAKTVLRLSPRIEVLPILHGSGDVAQEVRETLIGRPFDCVAVPLPPSFESAVESAVSYLPHLSLVAVPELRQRRTDCHVCAGGPLSAGHYGHTGGHGRVHRPCLYRS